MEPMGIGHVMCKFTTKKAKDSVHKNVDALSPRTISPMSDTMPVGIICETSSSGALGLFHVEEFREIWERYDGIYDTTNETHQSGCLISVAVYEIQ